jgi:hypothetical protein
MAANSKREQIILADVAIMQGVSGITTVERTIQTYSDLQDFAQTQLPVAAVVGRLPVPKNHIAGRDGQVDYIISELVVDVFVYIQAAQDQDVVVSSMLDDIWPALYADPRRGDLCMGTQLTAHADVEYWNPYVAFKVSCVHQYQHDTQGI